VHARREPFLRHSGLTPPLVELFVRDKRSALVQRDRRFKRKVGFQSPSQPKELVGIRSGCREKDRTKSMPRGSPPNLRSQQVRRISEYRPGENRFRRCAALAQWGAPRLQPSKLTRRFNHSTDRRTRLSREIGGRSGIRTAGELGLRDCTASAAAPTPLGHERLTAARDAAAGGQARWARGRTARASTDVETNKYRTPRSPAGARGRCQPESGTRAVCGCTAANSRLGGQSHGTSRLAGRCDQPQHERVYAG
jgi:hypothetical protein